MNAYTAEYYNHYKVHGLMIWVLNDPDQTEYNINYHILQLTDKSLPCEYPLPLLWKSE